jgi:hypothetical protein
MRPRILRRHSVLARRLSPTRVARPTVMRTGIIAGWAIRLFAQIMQAADVGLQLLARSRAWAMAMPAQSPLSAGNHGTRIAPEK